MYHIFMLKSQVAKYFSKIFKRKTHTHTPTWLSVVFVLFFVNFQESYKELRPCVIIIPWKASSSCSAYLFDHALILVNTLQIVHIARQ